MTNLMRQSQLRYLRRHTAVVVYESNDAGIEGPLSGLIQTGHGFGISLKLLADTAGRTGRGSDPGEPECTAGEVPVDKGWNVYQAVLNKHGTHGVVPFYYFAYL